MLQTVLTEGGGVNKANELGPKQDLLPKIAVEFSIPAPSYTTR
jgi:hypothetical protein